jgi:putative oxidoreductase
MSIGDFAKKLDNHPALGLDVLRIYIGIALFVRGATYIAHPEALVEYMKDSQLWVMPLVVSHYVVAAHVVGGILLALGLATRAAALAQVPVLTGAVFVVHWREGLLSAGQSLELSALVLALLLVISVFGAGEFSLDRVLAKSLRANQAAEEQALHHSTEHHPRPV